MACANTMPKIASMKIFHENCPVLYASRPPMIPAVAVMIKTAALLAISQREMMSSPFHSSLVMRGITLSALIHIVIIDLIV